ncbi:MAG: polysaccharide biosynthesis/export family protein [Bacteroidota bacterium]
MENHKVVLMQKADLKKKVVYDSVQRRYNAPNTYYRVQTNDLISVRYQSLTAKDVDFFAQETQANGATLNIGAGGNALLLGELVDKDGSIPVPVIGKVKVAGMTVFEIQDMIQELANKYLDSPIVKVRLLNYRFTVLGEVLKEGTVYVGNNRVNMFEAMGLAGGLGDLADRGKIKLVRTDSAGVTTVQYINLLDENFIMSPYYYVHQNDLLIVPPLRQRAYRKYFGPNLALVLSSLSIVLLTINLTK